jgi:uncharacterized protein (DUF342 family)
MSVEAKHLEPALTLAGRPEYAAVTGLASFVVEDGGMKAYAITTPPANGMLTFSERDMLSLMREFGITHGIIKEFMNFIPVGRKAKTLVAVGTPPEPGRDAVLRVLQQEPPDDEHGRDGSRNHRQVQHFIKVNAGEIIAEKTPATPGVPGMTVTGEPVPAAPGRDILVLPGRNTMLSEDGATVMAVETGVLQAHGDHIDVAQLLEIHGDVDYSVGNIDFQGCVRVTGDVLPGFKIAASDSIEVLGFVERATLEAGGDIVLHSGYCGDANCYIKTCGSLTARSLENADAKALRDLRIGKYLVNSSVVAGGDITVLDRRKGRIAGGHIVAGGNVNSRNIGSPSSASTIIDIGNSVELGTDKSMHFNTMRYYENRLEKINTAIALLRKRHISAPLNDRELEALHALENKARLCREHIRNLYRTGMAFQLKKKQVNRSAVHVPGTGYAGVQIQAAQDYFEFKDDLENVVVNRMAGVLAARAAEN